MKPISVGPISEQTMSTHRAMENSGPAQTYTMGYSNEFIGFQSTFAHQDSVNFLLPLLAPGQRLLDVGCGPGFLSVRLADAVAPGEMHGIDFMSSQIDLARATAVRNNCDNALFHVANAVDLPFEDRSFDVVHMGGVLIHVPDIDLALSEAKRVLRPGGILASRDLMLDSCFVHPELGVMRRSIETLADLVAADDGHPQIARGMKLHLQQAGFTDITISASFETYSSPAELEFFYAIVNQWFLGAGIADAAKKYGAMSDELMIEVARKLEEWVREPGALAGIAFGRAIAVRP